MLLWWALYILYKEHINSVLTETEIDIQISQLVSRILLPSTWENVSDDWDPGVAGGRRLSLAHRDNADLVHRLETD